jgi:hypothetical protein
VSTRESRSRADSSGVVAVANNKLLVTVIAQGVAMRIMFLVSFRVRCCLPLVDRLTPINQATV